ncbi:hypothetical protein EV127DRAFT_476748 [Xylaria flabelliformis]|nr:hypothetical protein EV127DRAFT_476748 [Xylaria flabelliformis]
MDANSRLKEHCLLFEAKKSLQTFDDGGLPIISEKLLPQMTAALSARRRLQDFRMDQDQDVYILAAASHNVCFLCFDITDRHLMDITMDNPSSTLGVTSTSRLNLKDIEGRKDAIVNA